jgi:hypothetical protein
VRPIVDEQYIIPKTVEYIKPPADLRAVSARQQRLRPRGLNQVAGLRLGCPDARKRIPIVKWEDESVEESANGLYLGVDGAIRRFTFDSTRSAGFHTTKCPSPRVSVEGHGLFFTC